MNIYSEEDIDKLAFSHNELTPRYANMIMQIMFVRAKLTNDRAKEYLTEGAGRRFRILYQCILNIFKILPPTRVDLLEDDEVSETSINLHAFYVDLFGLLDNTAWVFAFEKGLSSQLRRTSIGLYSSELQKYFSKDFSDFLNSDTMKNWHNNHLKIFRDALAHRIPLYVPPYVQDRTTGENFLWPAFSQSLDPSEQGNVMYLHPQLLADFNTAYAVLENFFEHEFGVIDDASRFRDRAIAATESILSRASGSSQL